MHIQRLRLNSAAALFRQTVFGRQYGRLRRLSRPRRFEEVVDFYDQGGIQEFGREGQEANPTTGRGKTL
jgi:hypothetical protein